jgi:hypothetical protein
MGDEDNDAIAARLAAMERDVLQREAAAEEKRLSLLREVARVRCCADVRGRARTHAAAQFANFLESAARRYLRMLVIVDCSSIVNFFLP